jgi:hypothetical protein
MGDSNLRDPSSHSRPVECGIESRRESWGTDKDADEAPRRSVEVFPQLGYLGNHVIGQVIGLIDGEQYRAAGTRKRF